MTTLAVVCSKVIIMLLFIHSFIVVSIVCGGILHDYTSCFLF